MIRVPVVNVGVIPEEPEGPCKDAGHPPARPGWVCRCACGWIFHITGRFV